MTTVTRLPTRLGTTLALLAATVSLTASAMGSPSGGALGVLGLVVLAAGLFRGSTGLIDVAGLCLLAGVFLSGWGGAPPEPLLVGAAGGVLAWDVGTNAVDVGEQLGRETRTTRLELVHVSSSLVVAALAIGIGYGTYLAAAGGKPVTAVVFLLAGVVVLVSGFR